VAGLGVWLNDLKAGDDPSRVMFYVGPDSGLRAVRLVRQGHRREPAGLNNAQLKRSYVWGMSWFIFSEVMFFAAFFGALFYTRGYWP
jgi:cytochrome c oxidase subunit III